MAAGTATHLLVAVFTARQDGVPKLERLLFVAQAMTHMAMCAGNRRRIFIRVEIFVVFVIFKAGFANIVQVTFDTRFVLYRDDDDGGLARQARIVFKGVPCRDADNGGPA